MAMKIFINETRNEMIFTEVSAKKFCMTFHDEYISLIENEGAKEITQVDVELDKNGVAKIDQRLMKIFEMRKLVNKAIICVGPYDIFGKKGYMVHMEGCKVTNPALEGAILEKLDWERTESQN